MRPPRDATWRPDIEYKYHPENVTALMGDPDPLRVVPDPLPPQLFNIADDPFEQIDLAESESGRAARMTRALDDWFAAVEIERERAQRETLAG